MSKETLSVVTTLVLHYNIDVMDARDILQKCFQVEYLDISEFLKNHEIERSGSSGELLIILFEILQREYIEFDQ